MCIFTRFVSAFNRLNAPPLLQTDAVRALTDEKVHTMQLMVEQERRNVDQLRQEVAAAADSSASVASRRKKQTELESAVRRLSKMQEQLDALREQPPAAAATPTAPTLATTAADELNKVGQFTPDPYAIRWR